ncbi:MFS transporter [Streptomyces mirabilis]|uniref:MFS transporter n=1 Tax=Streptomyces mirabilis TaxID=68239 RepID=UPI0036B4A5AE
MTLNRNATLHVVAAAYGLSSMGDQMAVISLTLRFHHQGRSGVAISAIIMATLIPVVIVGPLLAPILDRMETRRLIVAVNALQAIAATWLSLAESDALIIGLLALLGAGLAVNTPALQLLVPQITEDEEASKGYARLESFRACGNAAGPALAGIVVAATNERVPLLANAGSFATMTLAFACLPIRRPPVLATRMGASWSTQVRQGFSILAGDRILRSAIVTLACVIIFASILSVAWVFFTRDDLHASDTGYGLLVTAHTFGMLLGSATLAHRIPLPWQSRVLVGSGALMGCSLIGSASIPVFPVALAGFTLTGIAQALQILTIRNLIHGRIPNEVRGRAFAFSGSILNGAFLAGAALGGPVTALLGGAGALQLAGVGALTATLITAPLLVKRSAPAAEAISVVEASDTGESNN